MSSKAQAKIEYEWQAHPLRERVVAGGAAVVVIAALAMAAAVMGGNSWWGVLAATVLLLALNRFFFPSRFVIDQEGISARYPLRTQRMRWSELRRFVHDKHGGYLSRRARGSRLDAWTGMHILFGPPAPFNQREEIIQRIRAHMALSSSEQSTPQMTQMSQMGNG